MANRRYPRAAVDIAGMEEKRLLVLPRQRTALTRAGEALDQMCPHGACDLAAAIGRNPQLAHVAAVRGMTALARHAPELGLVRGHETPEKELERKIEMQRTIERQRDRRIDR